VVVNSNLQSQRVCDLKSCQISVCKRRGTGLDDQISI